MRDPVGSPEFQRAYEQLLADSNAGKIEQAEVTDRVVPGTMRALFCEYYNSVEFKALSLSTQTTRRRVLDAICREPLEPDSEFVFGQMPVQRFGAKAVRVLRDRKADLPEAANARLKALSPVFVWAIEAAKLGIYKNPVRDVKRLKGRSGGGTRGQLKRLRSLKISTLSAQRRGWHLRCCSTPASGDQMLCVWGQSCARMIGLCLRPPKAAYQ